jgi:ubiquinone/menaquinone biosynthesis C-methylase UbiE
MDKNPKKVEFKEWVAGVFDRASDTYDNVGPRFFTYHGKGLVEFSNIKPGSHVLDIACGKGAVLIPAGNKVGEEGKVIGIDISSSMVSKLESELKSIGISNAKVLKMDAEDLQFEDQSFDAAFCGLALFFFPDLGLALRECKRVLKPGGHFYFSTFAGFEAPWQDKIAKISKSYQEKLAPAPTAETKAMDKEAEIEKELEAVGFVDLEHMVDSHPFYFEDENQWWDIQWSTFQRAFLERLDPNALDEFKQEVFKIVQEHIGDRGIPVTYSVRYSRAKKEKGDRS